VSSESVRALAADATRQLAGGDQSSTRTVYAVVLALVAIGVVLIFIGAWIVRQTKPDPELLAPLERMADRSWRQQDPAQKRLTLDEARPDGAKPLFHDNDVPKVDDDGAPSNASISNFDDLRAQLEADRRLAVQGDPLMPPHLDDAVAEVSEQADQADQADNGEGVAHPDGSALQDDK